MTLTRNADRFVFGSVAVTTCFNDLGLLQLGFEHPTSLCLLDETGDLICIYDITYVFYFFFTFIQIVD